MFVYSHPGSPEADGQSASFPLLFSRYPAQPLADQIRMVGNTNPVCECVGCTLAMMARIFKPRGIR